MQCIEDNLEWSRGIEGWRKSGIIPKSKAVGRYPRYFNYRIAFWKIPKRRIERAPRLASEQRNMRILREGFVAEVNSHKGRGAVENHALAIVDYGAIREGVRGGRFANVGICADGPDEE